MRKRRFLKMGIWTGAIVAVVLFSAYFTMNYAVDRMLRTLSVDIEKPMNSNPVEDPGKGEQGGTLDLPPQTESPTPSASPPPSPSASPSASASNQNSEGPPSTTPAKEPSPSSSSSYEAHITKEKAAEAEQKISFREKTKITSVFLKRLDTEDMKSLMNLASGEGISIDEKKKAKKLILEKLSAEEYDELISIAAKLGLSQGKTYMESKKNSDKK